MFNFTHYQLLILALTAPPTGDNCKRQQNLCIILAMGYSILRFINVVNWGGNGVAINQYYEML